jgi:hypothetical protein
MPDDLTPLMRERLEKWRQNTLPVKDVEKLKAQGRFLSKCRMVRGDYGDDIKEFEEQLNAKNFAQSIKK